MTYQPRFYREKFSNGRFESFSFALEQTDLWVGVDKSAYCVSMIEFCKMKVKNLRDEIERYIRYNPEFLNTLDPIVVDDIMPELASEMAEAANKAKVGPMAAIAGCFAGYIGRQIMENYNINELVIENGGDIFASVVNPLSVSVYAGESFFSDKTVVIVPPGTYGICTSSGTVGHSYSMGKADAVMVICKDITLADAYATALANRVQSQEHVDNVVSLAKSKEEILSCVIVCEDKIGICGKFDVVF